MPMMLGALSQTDEPDGEVIDTEVEETSPLGGYSPDMLKAMVLKAQRPNEGLSTAYARMADALKASRGPDKSQMWLSLAAALGKPTRTGAIGEVIGNAAEALGTYRSARTEAKQKGALGLAELEYKYAADQDAATQKQGLEAMKLLSKMQGGGSLNANEKLRLGYALRLYPEKTREQIISEGLLYSGAVDARVNNLPTDVAATNSGFEREVSVPDAPVSETLAKARAAIAKGANRGAVLRRLEILGIPTDGL
jgi:hypothetical protein